MKNPSTLLTLALLTLAGSTSGGIIASWYAFDDAKDSAHVEAADSVASDWTVSLTTSARGSQQIAAAQSGTRDAGATGPVVDPTTTDLSGLQTNIANTDNATTTFTFLNNTGAAVELDHFYYDYKKTSNGTGTSDTTNWGSIDVILVSGFTEGGSSINNLTANSRAIGTGNYFSQGVDVDLSAYSIAAGAEGTLTMVLTWDGSTASADPTWHKAATFDNMALTAVPESSTLGFLAFLMASATILKRRRSA